MGRRHHRRLYLPRNQAHYIQSDGYCIAAPALLPTLVFFCWFDRWRVVPAQAGGRVRHDQSLRVAYRPCRRLVVRLDLHLVVRLLGFGSSERGCSSRLHLAAGSRLSRHAVTIYAPCCIGADECADDNLPFETRPANILRRQVTTET